MANDKLPIEDIKQQFIDAVKYDDRMQGLFEDVSASLVAIPQIGQEHPLWIEWNDLTKLWKSASQASKNNSSRLATFLENQARVISHLSKANYPTEDKQHIFHVFLQEIPERIQSARDLATTFDDSSERVRLFPAKVYNHLQRALHSSGGHVLSTVNVEPLESHTHHDSERGSTSIYQSISELVCNGIKGLWGVVCSLCKAIWNGLIQVKNAVCSACSWLWNRLDRPLPPDDIESQPLFPAKRGSCNRSCSEKEGNSKVTACIKTPTMTAETGCKPILEKLRMEIKLWLRLEQVLTEFKDNIGTASRLQQVPTVLVNNPLIDMTVPAMTTLVGYLRSYAAGQPPPDA